MKMKYFKTEEKIDYLKPGMGTILDIQDLKVVPRKTIAMAKADGEFTKVVYDKGGVSYTVNKNGYRRELDENGSEASFPALYEFIRCMHARSDCKRASFLAELHSVDEHGPTKLPTSNHYLKNGNPDFYKYVRIGMFDILDIDGLPVKESYLEKCIIMGHLFEPSEMVYVLPYTVLNNEEEAKMFWDEYVDIQHWEGLVVHDDSTGEVWKVKQLLTIDAVVMGAQKTKQLVNKNMVSSLKLALMKGDGTFLCLGSASGLNYDEQRTFYKFVEKFKTNEDKWTIYVEPLAIVEVEATQFLDSKSQKWDYDGKLWKYLGQEKFVSLRHPRFIRVRNDKKVNSIDLRINQIPVEVLEEVK